MDPIYAPGRDQVRPLALRRFGGLAKMPPKDPPQENLPVKPVTAESLVRSGEVQFEFFRSPGPGGQNVNKVSSAVRLRWDMAASIRVPAEVKDRLKRRAGRKITRGGAIVIEARRFRTQERNREDALHRLQVMIQRAWSEPRPRRATRPTEVSKERRLEGKKRRGRLKRDRSSSDGTAD
jgi:ribosome-associated protein